MGQKNAIKNDVEFLNNSIKVCANKKVQIDECANKLEKAMKDKKWDDSNFKKLRDKILNTVDELEKSSAGILNTTEKLKQVKHAVEDYLETN